MSERRLRGVGLLDQSSGSRASIRTSNGVMWFIRSRADRPVEFSDTDLCRIFFLQDDDKELGWA
jgi:hypothetical protein